MWPVLHTSLNYLQSIEFVLDYLITKKKTKHIVREGFKKIFTMIFLSMVFKFRKTAVLENDIISLK